MTKRPSAIHKLAAAAAAVVALGATMGAAQARDSRDWMRELNRQLNDDYDDGYLSSVNDPKLGALFYEYVIQRGKTLHLKPYDNPCAIDDTYCQAQIDAVECIGEELSRSMIERGLIATYNGFMRQPNNVKAGLLNEAHYVCREAGKYLPHIPLQRRFRR